MDEDQKRWIYWGVPIVVVVGLGAALWYGRTHKQVEEQPAAQAPVPTAAALPPQPAAPEPKPEPARASKPKSVKRAATAPAAPAVQDPKSVEVKTRAGTFGKKDF